MDDPSTILAFVRSFNPHLLPVVAIVLIMPVTLLFHLTAKAYILLRRWTEKGASISPGKWDAYLGGSIGDSINASFAFAAFFSPLTVFTISIVLVLANWNPNWGRMMAPGLGALLGVLMVVYFPSALSSTHPHTSFGQAFFSFSVSLVLIFLLVQQLARLF